GTVTKTTAVQGPDGSTLAVSVGGTDGSAGGDHADIYSASRTLTVGDWLVFGCWVRATSTSKTIGGVGALEMNITYNPGNTAGTQSTSGLFGDDCSINDLAWKWLCGAYKILTVGAGSGGSSNLTMVARCKDGTFQYFNPCIQYIPVSLGYTDGD